ncbi:MAG: Crp/Fnr family transcriptional regulator [Candidatus Dormibacteria bacterium]
MTVVFEEGTFLAAVPAADREALVSGGRQRTYRKGAPLLVEGESSDRVAVIVSGRVKVFISTDDGREVVLSMRGPGDLIGELSFLDGGPRSATAAAVEEVRAVVLSSLDFRAYLSERPVVTLVLLQMLSRRLREADAKLAEFTAHDSVGRVAKRLLELADRYGRDEEEGLVIDLALSQEELAGWTGSSREAVSKALGALRQLGWVQTRRRGFVILDLDALRRRAR